MKINDRIAVQIEGTDVAEAIVEDMDDGNVTLIIPATRLVVRMRQSLDLQATKEPEVDRILAGTTQDGNNESDAVVELNTPAPTAAPSEAPRGIGAEYSTDVGEGIHNMTRFPGEMD
jgi:hypothetical protein